jgi:hypothetical protein
MEAQYIMEGAGGDSFCSGWEVKKQQRKGLCPNSPFKGNELTSFQ